MASKKQIDANRRNAEKSTGPTTEEGKARSSKNALKHGMYSEDILMFHEDFDGYELFRHQLFVDHEPKTAAEFFLMEQMLQSYFMSRRAIFMMGDADNASVHGGKPTTLTYPGLMKMKHQNDRTVQKAIQMLADIRREREAAAKSAPNPKAKSPKSKDLPENGFVPPEYPHAPEWMRQVPYEPPR